MKAYIVPETLVLAIEASSVLCASRRVTPEIIKPGSYSNGSNAV